MKEVWVTNPSAYGQAKNNQAKNNQAAANNEGEEKKQLMFNVLEAELKNEHAQKSAKDTYLTENR
jgi:hypothetical protein